MSNYFFQKFQHLIMILFLSKRVRGAPERSVARISLPLDIIFDEERKQE